MADNRSEAVVPLEVRLPIALGWSPLSTTAIASAVCIAGAVIFAVVMRALGLGADDSIVTLGFATRVAIVASVSIGYALGVWLWSSREEHREFVELGIEHERIDEERDPKSLYAVPPRQLRISRWAGVAGIAFFVSTIEIPNLVFGGSLGDAWSSIHNLTYMLLLGIVFFWVMGRVSYFSTSRHRIGDALDRLPIDLLDRKPLQVFGKAALRNAFIWVAGTSIAALAFVNSELRIAGSLLVFVPVSLAALVIGTAAMFLPMRGLHTRIVAAKADELRNVEAAIRGDANALAHTRIADRDPPPTLADLVAYRDLVEKLPEWPLDASSIRRLGLYLLLPIGSWIGGALMERAIGVVLD